jgi:predicted O-methyltransferase YrrM
MIRGVRLGVPRSSRLGAPTQARVRTAFARTGEGLDYYDGVVVGAETLGDRALAPATLERVLETLRLLEPDDYLAYVTEFVAAGRRQAGESWRYADILTVLAAAAELLQPESYLEIGVRRGRSAAMLASVAPECAIVGLDLWEQGYAGMENPGPDFVRRELAKVGHRGPLELLQGDSHELLPRLFDERPDLTFDVVTVDGDHSPDGAERDLRDVLPRLRFGGALVFDDVRHPAHPELHEVWERVVASDRRYAAWRFDGVGYGVALAVRRW